jgi:acyl carrier protein
MEIQKFIENFAEQFDDTELEAFKPETPFRDLEEYSSIIALSIIAMIDEEYGVAISGSEMKSAVTIEELFNIVQAKLD